MDLAWQVLDVQGAELQVLRGMEALLRGPALQTAVIEVSGTELYSGQALQAEVVTFMREHGFHCVKDCACEFHCDTLFSRTPVQPPPRLPTRCVSKECIARQQQLHDAAPAAAQAELGAKQVPASVAAVEAAAAAAAEAAAAVAVVEAAAAAAVAVAAAAAAAEVPPAQAMVVTPPAVAAPARRLASVFTEPPSSKDVADVSGRPSFPWRACADGACAVVSVFTGGVADEWRNLYATLRRIGLHQMARQPVKTVHSSRQDGQMPSSEPWRRWRR